LAEILFKELLGRFAFIDQLDELDSLVGLKLAEITAMFSVSLWKDCLIVLPDEFVLFRVSHSSSIVYQVEVPK
jgi:hypothetical protein